MKLLDFTTWQHCSVPIPPPPSSYPNIIHQIIPPSTATIQPAHPNNNNNNNNNTTNPSPARRKKRNTLPPSSPPSSTPTTTPHKSVSGVQPRFMITTPNQICILGNDPADTTTSLLPATGRPNAEQSKRRRALENGEELASIPQWTYETRPGASLTSLLPHQQHSTKDENDERNGSGGGGGIRSIGAVVDPESRTIFALQRNNLILNVWNLDAVGVMGPDHYDHKSDATAKEAENGAVGRIVQKFSFDSPVVCLEPLPPCGNGRVSGKRKRGRREDVDEVLMGGVVGCLEDGRVFLVVKLLSLASSSSSALSMERIEVEVFGTPMKEKKMRGKKKKIRTNGGGGDDYGQRCILSMAGIDRHHSKPSTAKGQEKSDDDAIWGDITLTTISIDNTDDNGNTSGNSMTIRRHRITIPSSIFKTRSAPQQLNKKPALTDGKEDHTIEDTEDSATKPSSLLLKACTYSLLYTDTLKLPHAIRNKTNTENTTDYYNTVVQATKMDDGHHTAIVYHAQDHIWYCVMLTVHNKLNPPKHVTTTPFPIHRQTITPPTTTTAKSPSTSVPPPPPPPIPSSTTVTAIGSLHPTILTILTSDYILTTIDTNRATILNQINVRSLFRTNFALTKLGMVRISTHHSGTIAIVNYDSTESPQPTLTENGKSGGVVAVTPMNGKKMMSKRRTYLASVCTARITLFDQGRQRPLIKTMGGGGGGGGYDLSDVVASSVATIMGGEGRMGSKPLILDSFVERDMGAWFPRRRKKKKMNRVVDSSLSSMALTVVGSDDVVEGVDRRIGDMVAKLESFRCCYDDGKKGNNNGHGTFLHYYNEVERCSFTDNDKSQPAPSFLPQQHIIQNDTPQIIIDTALSIAIDRILNPRTIRTDRIDTNVVLQRCIRSGKVSGHTHLERATSRYSRQGDDNIFFSILLSLDYQGVGGGNTLHDATVADTARPSLPQSLLLIDTILEYCRDSVTEHMLVNMLHFVVCHVTKDQMALYWEKTGDSGWRAMVSQEEKALMKSLEERLEVAKRWMTMVDIENAKDDKKAALNGKKKNRDEDITKMLKHADKLMKVTSINAETEGGNDNNEKETKENQEVVSKKVHNLISNLQTRLFTHQQMHFVRKIVTFSKCNEALLRTALKHGLTQADNGEVEVLMKILTKLLEYKGTTTSQGRSPKLSSTTKRRQTVNPTVCIAQWLSALTDSHMGILYKESMSSTSNFAVKNMMEKIQSMVSSAIAQGDALLNLMDLLRHIDVVFEKEEGNELLSQYRKRKRARLSMNSNIPVYSIESITF